MSLISDIISTWRKEAVKMLPPSVRSLSIVDWFTSLLSPLQTNLDSINPYEQEVRRRLKYQGQIMVIQASLDELFGDGSPPFIRIETNTDPEAIPAFFYNEPEGIPTSYFYNESEIPNTTYFSQNPNQNTIPSFRVLIPIGIYTPQLEEKVRAEVQLYKIAGKLFTITTY